MRGKWTMAGIALAVFVAVLPLPLAAGGRGTDGLVVSGKPFLPWRVNLAVLESEQGIVGRVAVYGSTWQGKTILLFEANEGSWARSVDVAFYLDEDMRYLRFSTGSGEGSRDLELDLSNAPATQAGAVPESARRAAIRNLVLPFAHQGIGSAPREYRIGEGDLDDEALAASKALFKSPPPLLPLSLLGVFAFTMALTAGLPSPKRKPAAVVALSILASGAVCFLLPSTPSVTIVDFRPANMKGPHPRVAAALLAERREESPAISLTRYAQDLEAPGTGPSSTVASLELVAFSTRNASSIPLDSLSMDMGFDCRFSEAPLVVKTQDGFALRSRRFILGWILHERG